jgi:hypothetical protein
MRLARIEVEDEGVRMEIDAVDAALVSIREVLSGQRWI